MHWPSLAAVTRGYSLLWWAGSSLGALLLLQSTGYRACELQQLRAQELWLLDSIEPGLRSGGAQA